MTAGNGLPCVKCGTSEWYRGGECKKCHREYGLAWQRNNPERAREYCAKRNRNNREKLAASAAAYRRNNPEKARESVNNYRRKNPEYKAAWKRNNPDRQKAYKHRRMARKAGNGGSFTAGEWKALCNHYGNKCLCCGRDNVKLTFDHVIPVSKGGTSDISNGQPLCKSCNSVKNARHIDYRPDAGPLRWTQPALMSLQHD